MSVRFVTSTVFEADDRTKGAFAQMQRNAQKTARSMRGVRKAGEKMSGFGKKMSAGLSVPIAAFSANSVRMAANFDSAMNAVEAKTGETGDQLQRMRELAKELGSTTAFSASQAAQGMSFLAQAGFYANEILMTTNDTLSLAAAGQLDLAEAADIASNVFQQFKFNKDIDNFGVNFKRTADVLASVAASTNVSVKEIAESMNSAGPVAAEFGVTLEQTAAAVGALGNVGIKGTESGTALRNMLQNLAAPAGKAAGMLTDLGLAQSDFFKLNKDGKEVFLGFQNAITKMQESGAKTSEVMSILGLRAGPKMASLMSTGADGLAQIEQKLSETGSAGRMAETMMKGLPGQLAKLTSAFEGFVLALSEAGVFEDIVSGIEGMTESLREMAKTDPDFLKKIGKSILALAAIGPAIATLGNILMGVAGIAVAFSVIAGAISLPVVAIVGLVGLIGWALHQAWDDIKVSLGNIKDFFVTTWENIAEAAGSKIDILKSDFRSFIDFVKGAANKLKSLVGFLPDAMIPDFMQEPGAVKKMAPPAASNVVPFRKMPQAQESRGKIETELKILVQDGGVKSTVAKTKARGGGLIRKQGTQKVVNG